MFYKLIILRNIIYNLSSIETERKLDPNRKTSYEDNY